MALREDTQTNRCFLVVEPLNPLRHKEKTYFLSKEKIDKEKIDIVYEL